MITRHKLLGLLALIVPACGDDTSKSPPSCSDPGPSFVVLVRADVGPLPEDTVMRVTYGAGREEHAIGRGSADGEVVFCQPSERDGSVLAAPAAAGAAGEGAGGAAVGGAGGDSAVSTAAYPAALCALYTEGSASVDVVTAAYPPLHEDLEAEMDDCGSRTVSVQLELGAQEPETN